MSAFDWRGWCRGLEMVMSFISLGGGAGQCSELENNIDLHVGVDDSWRLSVASHKDYTASCVYHMLTAQKPIAHIVTNDTIWNKSVTLKVSRFAWWL